MRRNFLKYLLVAQIVFLGCTERKGNYISLFNGKDLSQWNLGEEGGFEVIEGEIFTSSFKVGSHLFSKNNFGNYILRLEYMLSDNGNSGVMIRCNPENAWSSGAEIQLLSARIPQRDDLHCTGSLYGHVAVSNRPDETAQVWHEMEVKCDRNLITIHVDDKMVTNVDIDTVASMKDKLLAGAIGFQVNHATKEGQYAKFRNIFIKDLDLEPEYVSAGFYKEDARWRKQAYGAATSIGAAMIDSLAVMMSEDNPVAKSGAKQVLFDIVARASSPESSMKEREDIARALKKSTKKVSSEITGNYLKWLSGMIE